MISDIHQLDFTKQYSYAEYLTWRFEERVELIKGWVTRMSPSASRKHQKISMELSFYIRLFLEGKKCEVYTSPSDVRFLQKSKSTDDKEIYTVVQPDIYVVCDLKKMDDKGCVGAPDLVIEILSISNLKHDIETKFKLYEENGVPEYWLVFPNDETIQVFDLIDNKYQLRKNYTNEDIIEVRALQGLEIDSSKVFKNQV
jgi:Uma2 family endonuclease